MAFHRPLNKKGSHSCQVILFSELSSPGFEIPSPEDMLGGCRDNLPEWKTNRYREEEKKKFENLLRFIFSLLNHRQRFVICGRYYQKKSIQEMSEESSFSRESLYKAESTGLERIKYLLSTNLVENSDNSSNIDTVLRSLLDAKKRVMGSKFLSSNKKKLLVAQVEEILKATEKAATLKKREKIGRTRKR